MMVSSFVKHLLLVQSAVSHSTLSKGDAEAWTAHSPYDELCYVQRHALAVKGNAAASTPAPPSTCDLTPDAAISGHNIEQLTGQTVVSCQVACNTAEWCKSFDWYKNSARCDLSDKCACDVGGLKTDYAGDPYDHYSCDCEACPTPSPPADVSGGHGDPHMINIMGEKFDIWRLGAVELLRIPRDAHDHPQIHFIANVSSEHETESGSLCAGRYMTAMRLSGSWFGDQEVYVKLEAGEMRVHVGKKSVSPLDKVPIGKSLTVSRPSESLVTVLVGDATINVMHDNAVFKPHFYLNTEVRDLSKLE